MSATNIKIDDERTSPAKDSSRLTDHFDLLQMKVKKCSLSCSNILVQRTTSSPQHVDEASTYSSNSEAAEAPGGERGRTWL